MLDGDPSIIIVSVIRTMVSIIISKKAIYSFVITMSLLYYTNSFRWTHFISKFTLKVLSSVHIGHQHAISGPISSHQHGFTSTLFEIRSMSHSHQCTRLYSTSKSASTKSRSNSNAVRAKPAKPGSSSISSDKLPKEISSNELVATPDEVQFRNELQSLRKLNATKKILQLQTSYQDSNKLTPYMALSAARTLHRLERMDLVSTSLSQWKSLYTTPNSVLINNVNSTVQFVHECCKFRQLEFAEEVYNLAPEEVRPALYADMLQGYGTLKMFDKVKILLDDIKSYCDQTGSCEQLNKEVIKTLLKALLDDGRALAMIVDILTVLLHLDRLANGSLLDDYETTQLFASHYLKKIEFIKGAVSMATLPKQEGANDKIKAEIAFIGRSNVGKSSLINMICNRKSLAYTSKTPGKTSEFNYFAAFGGNRVGENDQTSTVTYRPHRQSYKRELAKKKDLVLENAAEEGLSRSSAMAVAVAGEAGYEQEFYLVDLPGVGFAEATRTQRSSWLELLRSYTAERSTLRVLFHLIDSRHGALEADGECFELLSSLPSHVLYVVVLTKIDKTRGQTINQRIVDDIRSEINSRLTSSSSTREVPIIMTSSMTRDGGVFVWQQILRGLLYDDANISSSLQREE
jgi:GTP-binding protein EngB required for normal cell division